MKKYIKKVNDVNVSDIMSPRLPQSKSYLNILGIFCFVKNTNLSITSDIIESVIKSTYIFNNTILASHPYVIKVSSKSNRVVIQINIYNLQNSMKAKYLINRSFNIEYYITMIRGTNMNFGVPQCKNCWKQGYTVFIYHIYRIKCLKYNSVTILTTKANIRQTTTIVCSGNTDSIGTSTTRNYKSSKKLKLTQFAQLQAE